MRERAGNWAARPRPRSERGMVCTVVAVAVLIVIGEISGMLGYW